ncbi:uncharacterized protein LOC130847937 isoform X1 [Hippopotamus amphibius kiboko]|uniref:uncharacterized protein LOC130847937 isoform X1 n=1 Tax=Hippopotamus amphibius kiboko TaxID=575201 RepID=UPI002599F7B3|nr:uncharacterized protein LOC130847937 isoform X1 [Hippopotamus amphibius kiboko]
MTMCVQHSWAPGGGGGRSALVPWWWACTSGPPWVQACGGLCSVWQTCSAAPQFWASAPGEVGVDVGSTPTAGFRAQPHRDLLGVSLLRVMWVPRACPSVTQPSLPADEEEVAGCTLTRDRVCQCRPGHFYLHPGSSEICSRCSRCPKGHVVVQRCNTTEDTVCSFPGLERRHWWSLIGSFLFVSVVVTLFFWLSKKPTGCMSAHPGLSNGVGDHRQSMLPEHSVCSLPANQDRGAQSAVHMMENFSPSKDSLDVMSEAPTATRTLESLAGVNGPQAAAGERGRTPQPMPSAPSEPELPVDLQQLPLEAISLAVGSRKHVEERGNGGHSRLLPSRLCGAPWRGWRGVYPVRGAGCGQLTEQSRIGWHQGDISSIITLLVSTSPRVYVPVVSSFHLKGDLLPVKTT